MLIRTYVFNEFGDWFSNLNRQLVAGCLFELAFFLNGNSRVGGKVADTIGFR